MRDRLPLILSSCSLILVVFATTPVGNTARSALNAVPFAKSADYAKLAGNATKLNGRTATFSGAPGTIPVVGSNGKLPASIGATGPRGERGKHGKNATSLWARVDGTKIAASSGKPTLTHPYPGEWKLTFSEDVGKCAVLATKTYHVADTDINAYASANTVSVFTFPASDPRPPGKDIPFTVAVLC